MPSLGHYDGLTPAQTASDMTLSFLFHPERANRLIEFNSRNTDLPSLGQVIDNVLKNTVQKTAPKGYEGEVSRIVNVQVVRNILALGANKDIHPQVKAITDFKLAILKKSIQSKIKNGKNENSLAHNNFLLSLISQYESNPNKFENTKALNPPDGSPIGSNNQVFCSGFND